MPFHKDQTLNNNHQIHAFEFADEASRLGAVGLTASDIGKVAKQIDNESYWVLIDDTIPKWIHLSDLPTIEITDPAVDAAVTQEIVDNNGGVVIVLTISGNSQIIADPIDTTERRDFTVANSSSSSNSISINGEILSPGKYMTWVWEGLEWIDALVITGGTPPGGVDMELQFNDGGAFGGTMKVNNLTKSLALGSFSPTEKLHSKEDGSHKYLKEVFSDTNTDLFQEVVQRSGGDIATPLATPNNALVYELITKALDGAVTPVMTDVGLMSAFIDGNVGDASMPSAFEWSTIKDGEAVLTKKFKIGNREVILKAPISLKYASTAVDLLTDGQTIIGVTDTSIPRTVTISTLDITAQQGMIFQIKDQSGLAGTNNITIATEASETIDGAASIAIDKNYGSILFYSDGSNLFVISKDVIPDAKAFATMSIDSFVLLDIITTGVAEVINDTTTGTPDTWTDRGSNDFTITTADGELEYTGSQTKTFKIEASMTLEKTGSGNNLCGTLFQKNSTDIPESLSLTQNATPGVSSSIAIVSLSTGDVITLSGINEDTNTDLELEICNVTISEV